MPKRATSTTFAPGDPRAAEAARISHAARAKRPIPQTAAEKIVAGLVALSPQAIEVLQAAVTAGDPEGRGLRRRPGRPARAPRLHRRAGADRGSAGRPSRSATLRSRRWRRWSTGWRPTSTPCGGAMAGRPDPDLARAIAAARATLASSTARRAPSAAKTPPRGPSASRATPSTRGRPT